jgi:Tfp pilus assembly protein PilN
MSLKASAGHAAAAGARSAAAAPVPWTGGFNLMPWRLAATRRLRRRRACEWLAALLVGCACGGVTAAWQSLQRTHAEVRREAVEQQLARLGTPLAQARRFAREADERRAALTEAQRRAQPLTRLFALVEVLARARTEGVVLEQLAQRGDETELQANATDEASAAAWLGRLHALPDVEAVNVREMKRAQDAGSARERAPLGAPIRVAARLVWKGAVASAPGAMRSVGARGEK